jgi:hypothetical protein
MGRDKLWGNCRVPIVSAADDFLGRNLGGLPLDAEAAGGKRRTGWPKTPGLRRPFVALGCAIRKAPRRWSARAVGEQA